MVVPKNRNAPWRDCLLCRAFVAPPYMREAIASTAIEHNVTAEDFTDRVMRQFHRGDHKGI